MHSLLLLGDYGPIFIEGLCLFHDPVDDEIKLLRFNLLSYENQNQRWL